MNRSRADILLLAAGGSSRFGRPKQLALLEGRALVRRAAEEALATECGPVTAVLGARAARVRRELEGLELRLCVNEGWEEGIASSIRVGLQACLDRDASLERVLVMLCDQPAVDRGLLRRLLALHAGDDFSATACSVQGRAGPPAIFESELFAALLALRGDQGAREILRGGSLRIGRLDFAAGDLDIDTPEDLRSLPKRTPGTSPRGRG